MEKKAPLRRELLARRDALPGREERSRAIQRQVLALPEYRRARRLLLYLSQGSEVDTWPLLARALAQGKEVYAPRCLERPGEMAFYRVSSREDLQAGAFGLLEPIPGSMLDEHLHQEGFCDHHDHFINSMPVTDWKVCLAHCEKIGVGSRTYELIEVK